MHNISGIDWIWLNASLTHIHDFFRILATSEISIFLINFVDVFFDGKFGSKTTTILGHRIHHNIVQNLFHLDLKLTKYSNFLYFLELMHKKLIKNHKAHFFQEKS